MPGWIIFKNKCLEAETPKPWCWTQSLRMVTLFSRREKPRQKRCKAVPCTWDRNKTTFQSSCCSHSKSKVAFFENGFLKGEHLSNPDTSWLPNCFFQLQRKKRGFPSAIEMFVPPLKQNKYVLCDEEWPPRSQDSLMWEAPPLWSCWPPP